MKNLPNFSFLIPALIVGATFAFGYTSTESKPHTNSVIISVNTLGPAMFGAFNRPDVEFTIDAIKSHTQIIEIANLAITKSRSAKVKGLAESTKTQKTLEVESMGGWIQGWGKYGTQIAKERELLLSGMSPKPSYDRSVYANYGRSPATVTPKTIKLHEISQLKNLTGIKFERLWTNLMIRQQKNSILIAQQELDRGQNPQATSLAENLIKYQTEELVDLERLAEVY